MPPTDERTPPPHPINYKAADVPPPVTRRERVLVVSGYVVFAAGFAMVVRADTTTPLASNPLLQAGLAALLVGGGVTAFCFIHNAVRRM